MIARSRGGLVATLLVTLPLGIVPAAWAQTRSTLIGTIRDAAGAALPGVGVTLVIPDASLKAQYVRRQYGDLLTRIDTGSRFEPVQRQDPGPDCRLGTSDDGQLITVFNLLNPGQTFSVLTNPEEAFRRYEAVQRIGQRRFSRNWQLLAAYTWSSTRGIPSGAFANPNSRINAEGSSAPDLRHQAGVQGVYQIPVWGGVTVSGAYSYVSGGAWGRSATFAGLRQGNAGVRIEPVGTRRTDSSSQVDLRVEKTFHVGASRRMIGIYDRRLQPDEPGHRARARRTVGRYIRHAGLVVAATHGAGRGTVQVLNVVRTMQVAVRIKL